MSNIKLEIIKLLDEMNIFLKKNDEKNVTKIQSTKR